MTKRAHLVLGFACALSLLIFSPAFADNGTPTLRPLPTNDQQVQDQLKTFDPMSVAAARHYYESPRVKDGILSMLKSMTPAIIANVEKQKGTRLSDADRAKLLAALDNAMSANFDFLIGLNMIAALEHLSRDELVALDSFYSSPTGQRILEKMPLIGQRLPGIMQVFMPKFVASMQQNIKANGFGTP